MNKRYHINGMVKNFLLNIMQPGEKLYEKIIVILYRIVFCTIAFLLAYNIELVVIREVNRPTRIAIIPHIESGEIVIRGAAVDGEWIDIKDIVVENISWKENKDEATFTATDENPLFIDLPRGEIRSLTFNTGPTAGNAEIRVGNKIIDFVFYNDIPNEYGIAYSLPCEKAVNIPFGLCEVIALCIGCTAVYFLPSSIYMIFLQKTKLIGNFILRKGKICLLPMATGIFALGFYTSTNPIWGYSGVDSAAFILMGRSILNGKIPYRDIADNKGFVLYAINALGQSLFKGEVYDVLGIWLLQVVFLFFSLILIGKIAKYLNHNHPLCYQIFYLITISSMIETGNMSEEYSNFFTVVGFYLCAEYFFSSNKKHLWKYGLVFGLAFSLNFFMRPNNALPLAGIIIVLIIYLIMQKKWKEIGFHAGFFLLGALIVCIPMAIYLYINNALRDCWLFTIQMNLQYSDVAKRSFAEILNTAYGKTALCLVSFSLTGGVICLTRKCYSVEKKAFCCTVIVSAALSFWSAFLSGYTFMHYLLVSSVPFVIGVMLIWMASKGNDEERAFNKVRIFGVVSAGIAALWIGIISWNSISVAFSNISSIPLNLNEYSFQTGGPRQTVLLDLASKIPEECRDSVMFIEDSATESTDRYVQMRIFPRERLFICQELFCKISDSINLEYEHYLNNPPMYMLSTIPIEEVSGRQSAFREQYNLVATDVYGTCLYERKDLQNDK